MRAAFGVASLLVALAIVGLLASKQMKSAGRATPPVEAGASMPAPAATVREQSQQAQDKVRNDVNKALEQGAARREEADK